MTAQIAGFVTRAEAGLRAAESFSRNITPEKGGVAEHWGGPAQAPARQGSSHLQCIITWGNWQKYHMNTHGWVDIAYTGGFCNHGYAFAGRGKGVRTAANGTSVGNQNFYAIVWIGGAGQTPTKEALDAADWWLVNLRNAGAGLEVRPHNYFKNTGCPGPDITDHAASRNGTTGFAVEPKSELRLGETGKDELFTTADQVRGRVCMMRHNAGLPSDPASDQIWVDRIVNHKSHHLGQARMDIYEKGFAAIRKSVGLPEDSESDQIWVDRVVIHRTHTMEDAKKAMEEKASDN